MVGADVLGGPRLGMVPVDVPWTRRAGDVAPYHGHRIGWVVDGAVRLCYNHEGAGNPKRTRARMYYVVHPRGVLSCLFLQWLLAVPHQESI